MVNGSYNTGEDYSGAPAATSGNYKMGPGGQFAPDPAYQAPHPKNIYSGTNDMVKALMTGYLRKGGGYGLTSAAPPGILQNFKAFDPYSSFGVPFSGINYGGGGSAGGGGSVNANPYRAIFSPTSGGGGGGGYSY